MVRRPNLVRLGLCAAALTALGLSDPGRLQADARSSARACQTSYDTAQARERTGQLREALQALESCAAANCSANLRQACQTKALRLEAELPSVVPLVKDQAGQPRVDAEVTIDGALLASRLDGRAFAVDPGLHEFAFRVGGNTIATQQVVIAQGQRNRQLWATIGSMPSRPAAPLVAAPKPAAAQPTPGIAPAKPAAETAPKPKALEAKPKPADEPSEPGPQPAAADAVASASARAEAPSPVPAAAPIAKSEPAQAGRGLPVVPIVLGGTAVAGVAAYFLLVQWGRDDNEQLAQCSPNCSPDSVSHIRNLYTAADISIGVAAAAALGTAAWFVLSGFGEENPKAHAAYSLTLVPERSGASALVRGTF